MTENDELKLVALQSLMYTSSEKAVPVLRKTLSSNASNKVKETAMFILSQKNSAEARQLLIEFAQSSDNPVLQRKAIEMTWCHQGRRCVSNCTGGDSAVK